MNRDPLMKKTEEALRSRMESLAESDRFSTQEMANVIGAYRNLLETEDAILIQKFLEEGPQPVAPEAIPTYGREN